MTAIGHALDALFADPHLAVDALWRAGGTGPGVPVRVIIRRPDAIGGFGESRALMASVVIDVRISEVAVPAENDSVGMGDRHYRVIATPRADALNLIWTCEAIETS